jgi:hypothetical protein
MMSSNFYLIHIHFNPTIPVSQHALIDTFKYLTQIRFKQPQFVSTIRIHEFGILANALSLFKKNSNSSGMIFQAAPEIKCNIRPMGLHSISVGKIFG